MRNLAILSLALVGASANKVPVSWVSSSLPCMSRRGDRFSAGERKNLRGPKQKRNSLPSFQSKSFSQCELCPYFSKIRDQTCIFSLFIVSAVHMEAWGSLFMSFMLSFHTWRQFRIFVPFEQKQKRWACG